MKAMYGDDSVSEYKGIYQAAMTGLQQESLTKNSFRIQDDFYFSKFHPIEDYNLQVYIHRTFTFETINDVLMYHSVAFIDNLLRTTAFN